MDYGLSTAITSFLATASETAEQATKTLKAIENLAANKTDSYYRSRNWHKDS